MERIAIITDSCASVPPDIAEEYDIFVLPLIIRAGGREYRAEVDITAAGVYELLKTELPQTSLPSAEEAMALLDSLAGRGYTHAIAVMLSGGLSGTVNMMRVVAEQAAAPVTSVWDSLSGSIGCGITAIEAARAVRAGKSFAEVNALIPELLRGTRVFFSVDTLEYLQKGGRVGKIAAIAGTALQIKPILTFSPDGHLVSAAKARGKKMAQAKLCELAGEALIPGRRFNLLVADGGDAEGGAVLRDRLAALYPDYEQYIYTNIDSVLSCYIGPGVLGAGIQLLP